MNVNFIEGTNYSSAPSWLTGAGGVLDQVQSFYEHLFTSNITIDITLNWVPLQWSQTSSNEGGVLANNNITSGTQGVTSSYTAVRNALNAHAGNAIQTEAYGNMPTSGVGNVYVAPAEAMVLGLETNQTVNIYLNVNSSANWLGADGFSPLDAFGAIAHEITETAMGRISNPGSTPDVMDMFRFSAAGQHDLTSGATSSSTVNSSAYFSVDDGVTNLGTWPNDPGHGDYGDWLQGAGPLPNDAYGTTGGGVAPISEVDIELMNVLGWGVAAVTSGVTSVVAGGQTYSGYTVMSGGFFEVLSGGVASQTYYTDAQGFNDGVIMPASAGGSGGVGYIFGVEYNATVDGGGVEFIESGGVAYSAKVLINGRQINYGLTENTVLSGGYEGVAGGAFAYYTSVLSGGAFHLDSNSIGYADVVLSGGSETVWGQSEFETIAAYGSQTVSSGGTDEFSTISGDQYVYGRTSGDTIVGGPSYEYVLSGGATSSSYAYDEGLIEVSAFGATSLTSLGSGGLEDVYSGGGRGHHDGRR